MPLLRRGYGSLDSPALDSPWWREGGSGRAVQFLSKSAKTSTNRILFAGLVSIKEKLLGGVTSCQIRLVSNRIFRSNFNEASFTDFILFLTFHHSRLASHPPPSSHIHSSHPPASVPRRPVPPLGIKVTFGRLVIRHSPHSPAVFIYTSPSSWASRCWR